MDFPITFDTQEAYDKAICERIARAEAKAKEPFADYEQLKTAAAKLTEIEEANKTELQKAMDRANAAESQAEAQTLRALRAEIAQTKNVPANLLSGNTAEELTKSADALIEFKGKIAEPAAAGSTFGQGNVGTSVSAKGKQVAAEEVDSMTDDQTLKALQEGRLDGLLNE